MFAYRMTDYLPVALLTLVLLGTASCRYLLGVGETGYCGNGIVDPGTDEECDDTGESATCDADCTLSTCGDGTLNTSAGEECDDGNVSDNDDCRNACIGAKCGDGIVWNQGSGLETCDDGNDNENDDCLNTCIAARCGDNIVWNEGSGEETCDDGNDSDNDDCLNTCTSARCGDGVVWNQGAGDEACDDGNDNYGDTCTSRCQVAECTNGLWNEGESDVDCGGDCGPSCGIGHACSSGRDCNTGLCLSGVCVARQLALGLEHTCALLAAGTVRCWGSGYFGQLGYGNDENIGDDESPGSAGDVGVGGSVIQLTAGAWHTCALLDTGAVRCWGRNQAGQLGQGHTDNIGDDETPVLSGDVDVGGTVVQLSAGHSHQCALLASGAVRCWGSGEYGQLGYGTTDDIGDDEAPATAGDVDVGDAAIQLSAGKYRTCALLTTGAVRCWGNGADGKLGYGHTTDIGDDEVPAMAGDVAIGGPVIQIAAGGSHTCALLGEGNVRCWGLGSNGQLGHGDMSSIGDDELPESVGVVDVGGAVILISAGANHTCALLESGSVRCWGLGSWGRLGYANSESIGDDEAPATTGDIDIGGPALLSAAGGYHSCALLTIGAVRCWGLGTYGRLGYGNVDYIGDDETPASAGDVNVGTLLGF